MKSTLATSIRIATLTLLFALPFNQFANAATLPKKLAAKLQAQKLQTEATGAPQTGPIPSQIATAHTIFLSNVGADQGFPASDNVAFHQVYTALQAWGKYQLVDNPAAADLIFQLRQRAPQSSSTDSDGNTYTWVTPAFQVTIIDPATSVTLWTLTSPVTLSGKKKEYDKWFALSVANLVSRVKVIAGDPLSVAETNDLTTFPKGGNPWVGYGILIGLLTVGIGGGLLMKHEFDKSVAEQNAALCKQNAFFCTQP